ncbi:MAG: SRPBCC family protein [Solirubrobacterales bacterium]
MGPVSAEIEVDVPRVRAFEMINDLATRPSFTDHFLTDFHLTRISSTGVGAGARFRVRSPLRSVWMDTVITELAPPHRIVEHGRGGRANRIPATTVWDLQEGAGGLTRIRLSRWTEPSNPVDRALELLAANSVWEERGWREALRRLRDLLESGDSAPPRVALAGGNRYATGIP